MKYYRDPAALTGRLRQIMNRDTVIMLGVMAPLSGIVELYFDAQELPLSQTYMIVTVLAIGTFLLYSIYRLSSGSILYNKPAISIAIYSLILVIVTSYVTRIETWYVFLWLIPVYMANFYFGRGKVLAAVLVTMSVNGFVLKPLLQTLYSVGVGELVADRLYFYMIFETIALLLFSLIIIDIQSISQEDNKAMATELSDIKSESAILRSLFQIIDKSVVVLSPDRIVMIANPAMLALRDTNDSMIGRQIDDQIELISSDGRSAEWKSLLENTSTDFETGTYRLRINRDTLIPIGLRIIAIVGDNKKLAGYAITITDLSEINRVLDSDRKFIAMVCNEFQKPILSSRSVLKESMPVIRQQVNNQSVLTDLESIDVAIDDMDHIQKDLQLFASADSEQGYQLVAHVQLGELVQECITALEPAANNRGLKIILKPGEPVEAMTDPIRLKAVIVGLLSNAIKYTSKGSVIVVCRRQENSVDIDITDTGRGISQSQLPILFEPYYSVNKSDDKRLPDGIGLYIAKRIILSLEGTLRVKSELGQGTTFTIELPATQVR